MEIVQYLMIGTNVIVGAVVIYYEAYVKSKAEAQVKIDTTEAITKIEESVKHVFQTELAKMQLEHQHRHSIALEQRNTIMDFNDRLHTLVRHSRLAIADNRYSENLWQYTYDTDDLKLKYKLSLERLRLFFDEEPFRKVEAETMAQVEQMESNTLNYIQNVLSMKDQIKQAEELKAVNIQHLKGVQSSLFTKYATPHLKMYEMYEILRPKMRAILTSYIERVYKK